MTSQRRKESSRLNGLKSRGPKTDAGLQRSSQNSLRHGLSLPILADPQLSLQAERLAKLIAGPNADEALIHDARLIAEAQIELQRVRRLRLERLAHPSLVNKRPTLKGLRTLIKSVESNVPDIWDQTNIVKKYVEDLLPDAEQELELSIGAVIGSFHRLDRYEGRALSKRKFAIRRFRQISK